MTIKNENYFFITLASNFLLCYDKYSQNYDKSKQKKSKHPFFYLLNNIQDLHKIKNKLLMLKKDDTDFFVKVNVDVDHFQKTQEIFENNTDNEGTKTGIGFYIKTTKLKVLSVEEAKDDRFSFHSIQCEHLLSECYQIKTEDLKNYDELKPRSLSYLPIKIACNAKCKFCFSKSSISINRRLNLFEIDRLDLICQKAKEKGATRFVLTGGGEPLLFGLSNLYHTLTVSSRYFDNNLMISNGKEFEKYSLDEIKQLKQSGLSRVAISIHHYDLNKNKNIMQLDVDYRSVVEKLKQAGLKVRFICVIQKEGVANSKDVEKYIQFALTHHVNEICFKELYVSTAVESEYYKTDANLYCINNQISLSIITDYCETINPSKIVVKLPWGAPVYNVNMNGYQVSVAAYTEPSVGFERNHGIARSWNIMADLSCFVTLEDENSKLTF